MPRVNGIYFAQLPFISWFACQDALAVDLRKLWGEILAERKDEDPREWIPLERNTKQGQEGICLVLWPVIGNKPGKKEKRYILQNLNRMSISGYSYAYHGPDPANRLLTDMLIRHISQFFIEHGYEAMLIAMHPVWDTCNTQIILPSVTIWNRWGVYRSLPGNRTYRSRLFNLTVPDEAVCGADMVFLLYTMLVVINTMLLGISTAARSTMSHMFDVNIVNPMTLSLVRTEGSTKRDNGWIRVFETRSRCSMHYNLMTDTCQLPLCIWEMVWCVPLYRCKFCGRPTTWRGSQSTCKMCHTTIEDLFPDEFLLSMKRINMNV